MRSALVGGLAAAAAVASFGVPASAAGTGPTLTISFLTSQKPAVGRNTPVPIQVRNLGPGRAVNVTLRVTAPTWVKLVRKGCVRPSGPLVCALHPIAAGSAVTVRVGVTPLHSGTYRLTARATASSPPPPGVSLTRETSAADPYGR